MSYASPNTTSWTDSQSNATATATVPHITGRRIRLKEAIVSYSAAATAGAKLQIKSGTTLLLDVHAFPAMGVIPLHDLRSLTDADDVTAVLDAGGAGIVGKVTLIGHYES